MNKTKILSFLLLLTTIINCVPLQPVFAQTATTSAQTEGSTEGTLPISSSPTLFPSPTNTTAPVVNLGTTAPSSAVIRQSPVVQRLPKKVYRSDEDVSISVANPQDESINASVLGADGKEADVAIQQVSNNGQVIFDVSPREQFRPGKYKLIISDSSNKTSEQDFTWGVLAINTDRSIYLPKQTADLSMAVLDDGGNMVCDAKVMLEIKNQSLGIDDTLSTDNGKITVNQQCQSHDFSLKPDYEAHYQVGAVGTYTLDLTATTKNGSYSIVDNLIVQDSVPFDVQRSSATRIYPPNSYPMLLTVTANQDFIGKITETVPDSFTITASDNTQSYDSMQTMYMHTKNDPASILAKNLGTLGNNADTSMDTGKQVLGASTSDFFLPFTGSYPITEGFGEQQTDPGLRKFYQSYGLAGHDGVDFGLPMKTPVRAVDDGTIVLAGPSDYGITIVIKHAWGKSYYGHLSTTLTTTVGQHVSKGDQIGLSGNTGEATGPHLHFGMKPNNPDMTNGYFGKINPLPYFNLSSSAEIADGTTNISSGSAVLGATTVKDVLGASPSASIADASPSATDTTSVPSFTNKLQSQIVTTPTTANDEKVKIITWNVSLKKGQKISLGYTFKTPQISPQFYLLGPLRFYDNAAQNNLLPLFKETRQWQIAADAQGLGWYDYNWQYRKQITIDHTKVSGAPLFDAGSSNKIVNSTTLTWSHTTGSQSSRILIVAVQLYNNPGGTVSTVTYGAASLTKVPSASVLSNCNSIANTCDAELWYLLAPTSGTATVTVTASRSEGNIVGGGTTFYNVDQVTPFGTAQTTHGSAQQNFSLNVTGTTPNQVIIDSALADNALTPVTPQAQVYDLDGTAISGGSSYKTGVTTTTTMSWTNTQAVDFAQVAVPINGTSSPTITQDAVSSANDGAGSPVPSLTWSHTVTAQSNSILIVGITTNTTTTTISSITYNGVSLTKLDSQNSPTVNFGHGCHTEMWYLLSPASGTHSILATLSVSDHVSAGAVSYYNVNQITPFGTQAKASNSTSPSSLSVTTTSSSQVVVDEIGSDNTLGAANGGQTTLWNTTFASSSGGSSKPGTGSSVSVGWSVPSADWAEIAVPMNPAPAGLTNFPVLINLSTDNDLKTNAQSTGNDILFTDSTGQTKLNHQVEKYNSATGELEAWVNVPTLSASVDTILYLYYGNSAAANQQNATSVWDSNFSGVWHLSDTGTNQNDSTSNANNATTTTVTAKGTATGQIAGADQFSELVPDFINIPTTTSLLSTPVTIQAWVKLSQLASARGSTETLAGTDNTYSLETQTTNKACFFWWNTLAASFGVCSNTTLTTGTWYHIVGTYDGSTTVKIYINGVNDSNTPGTPTGTVASNGNPFHLSTNNTTFALRGFEDEIRFSNTGRSAAWIATDYNNESSPSTFYTLGTVETKLFAPTSLDLLMRGGKWFGVSNGATVSTKQPYVF